MAGEKERQMIKTIPRDGKEGSAALASPDPSNALHPDSIQTLILSLMGAFDAPFKLEFRQ